MDRRALLATLASVSVTGCLGDSDPGTDDETATATETPTETRTPTGTESPDGEYEQCHLVEIRYGWLPDELQEEVDEALDGGYESEDRPGLVEAVDTDTAYVVVDERPYEPWADADSDGWVLELDEVDEVRLSEPLEINVENRGEREFELTVTLDGDEERIVGETLSLEPGERKDVEATETFGSYELCGETDEHGEECFEFGVSDSYGDGVVAVDGDGLFLSQAVAEIEPCPWDRRRD